MPHDSPNSEFWLTGDDVFAVLDAVPLSHELVVERLRAAGFDDVEIDEVKAAIRDEGRVADMEPGLVSVPALLDGVRWTVEVYEPSNDDEPFDSEHADSEHIDSEHDALFDGFEPGEWLVVENGAEPLNWWLVMNQPGAVRPDGTYLGTIETEGVWRKDHEIDVIRADHGWLAGALGGAVGNDRSPAFVEVSAVDGSIRVAPLDTVPIPTQRQIAAVQSSFEQVARIESMASHITNSSVELELSNVCPVIEMAVVHDRAAFVDDPSPRHDDLLTAAGLECRGRTVARSGADWTLLDAWRHRRQLVSFFGFSEEQAEHLQVLLGAAEGFGRGDQDAFGPPAQRLEVAAAFAALFEGDLEVYEGFVHLWHDRGNGPDVLLRFADEIIDILGEVTPGVGWLRATSLDLLGRPVEAAEELAHHTSSHHEGALVAAASFAADRSDGAEAHRLLRHAGTLDHLAEHDGEFSHDTADLRLLSEILPFATRPKATAKRNDPCPCGSGKKYKTCHLGSERHPITERASWLDQKADRFTKWRAANEIEDIAEIMAAELGFGAAMSLRTSEFVADLVRHEGGVFERFLAARSMFLPDDEAELAATWASVDRSVFVVESTQQRSMRLRDMATDSVITVSELAAPTIPEVGVILVGRPLPVGDTFRAFSGFIQIRPESVDDVLAVLVDGHAAEVAAVLGTALATATEWFHTHRDQE